MPIPTLITDLSTTAASNFPQGTDSPASLDDVQRAHASFIAVLRDGGGSYAPAGAGAVSTTVQGKLRQAVNTKDYGAPEQARTAAAAIASGGFWGDDPVPGNLWRFSDRLFVGDAATSGGEKQNPGTEKSWVGYSAGGYMTYFDSRSTLASYSSIGSCAIVGASRTSDNVLTSEQGTIGGAFYAKNDNTNTLDKKTAWAIYGHAAQETLNNATFGLELDTCSLVGAATVNPYLTGITGTVASIWCGVGGETAQALVSAGSGASLNNISCAIAIINSASSAANNRFSKGIVFGANSLAGADGTSGSATAIAMAKGHTLDWQLSSEVIGARIISTVGTTAGKQVLFFQDRQTHIESNDGIMFSMEDASNGTPANYVRVLGFAAGSNPQIRAGGSDANLSLIMQGKGSGGALLRDGNSSARVEVNTTGIGFNTKAPIAAPTITGSRGGNLALASLLTALFNYGLIADSTTA